ncbi:MAG: GFA family protein [Asticcacaulis sp.]
MTPLPITGGCQCGAVRYALHAEPGNAHFCHCRMCQRAVGGPFAALTSLRRADVEWTKGEPAFFQSSSVAKRGYCRDCGTPLSFAYDRSDRFSVTLGSLDRPEDAPIERHYGIESKMPWLKLCDGLPEEETGDLEHDPRTAGMVIWQSGEGA